nr:tetratricopeptide repeat protein 39B-like isoform X1 [Pocillopora verrucosa]
MVEAAKMITKAYDLCFSNKFLQAKADIEPWINKSMYHAVAYSSIMCIQALLKFEQPAIQKASESVKLAVNICERQRKKPTWSETFSSWIWSSAYDEFSMEEKHAELCYTECLLLDALLTFIQDDNLVSFVWGALKIRTCYQNYKTCLEMIADQPHSLSQSPLEKDFEAGVHFGIGGFNLVLSLLPPIIIKLLEWVGFSGDRFLGINHLHKGSKGQSLRSPLCSLLLLAYHTWITQYLGNGDGDIDQSEEILQPLLTTFPKGSLFLFYDGRIKQVRGKLEEAINRYKHSITIQSEIKQFHHIFYWELMWCHACKGDWAEAYQYAGILFEESMWSKTVYMHLKASFKLTARLANQPISDEEGRHTESFMFRRLPDFKQRIAGQSLPFEDFAIHKANKYFEQKGRLFLPGVELLFIWNGFKVLAHRPDLVPPLMKLVESSLHKLKQTKEENENYVDDLCLGKLLQGMCHRCLSNRKEAMECLRNSFDRSKDLKQDFYLAPYACAEIGFLYLDEGDFGRAKEYLERARKHRDHLLQSLLHLRIHAALQKIEQNSVSMGRPQVVCGQEFVQNGTQNELQVMNSEEMTESEDFFDAEEECANLYRQDSNSSFDIISDFSDEV